MEMQMTSSDDEWKNFLFKINDYANDSFEKWTSYTLLAFFLVKYKQVNGLDFIFSSNKRGPTKSRELKQAAVIWSMFDQNRYKKITIKEDKLAYKEQLVEILKSYIDWAFGVKFRGKETNVTGLGIFAVAGFMNEFLQWRKSRITALPRRNQPIPKALLDWAKDNVPDIFKRQQLAVLEDLNAILNYVEAYDQNGVEAIVIARARELGIMPKQGKMELNKK